MRLTFFLSYIVLSLAFAACARPLYSLSLRHESPQACEHFEALVLAAQHTPVRPPVRNETIAACLRYRLASAQALAARGAVNEAFDLLGTVANAGGGNQFLVYPLAREEFEAVWSQLQALAPAVVLDIERAARERRTLLAAARAQQVSLTTTLRGRSSEFNPRLGALLAESVTFHRSRVRALVDRWPAAAYLHARIAYALEPLQDHRQDVEELFRRFRPLSAVRFRYETHPSCTEFLPSCDLSNQPVSLPPMLPDGPVVHLRITGCEVRTETTVAATRCSYRDPQDDPRQSVEHSEAVMQTHRRERYFLRAEVRIDDGAPEPLELEQPVDHAAIASGHCVSQLPAPRSHGGYIASRLCTVAQQLINRAEPSAATLRERARNALQQRELDAADAYYLLAWSREPNAGEEERSWFAERYGLDATSLGQSNNAYGIFYERSHLALPPRL